MTNPKKISILDYTYHLPVERIALHPLPERDASKLLIFRNGIITKDIYKNIALHLSANSLLIYNNTRVIKARLRFQKNSGGVIEVFCLEPYETINEYSQVMNKRTSVKWKCLVGGKSKWKEGKLLLDTGLAGLKLEATLIEKLADAYVVEFSWTPADTSFAEVLELCGDIPLPPYIKRKTETEDAKRYQTIYAEEEGSVAAPTAGLHFTEAVFKELKEKNIQQDFVTLHVGAGTFKPVKAGTMGDHEMHAEWIDVSSDTIENIIKLPGKNIVAVGTTSLRTLESLYWMGVKALLNPALKQLSIDQWEVYEEPLINQDIPVTESMTALLKWMKANDLRNIFTRSQILIAPGYVFKIANAIITNFHQPESTLLLLVAAASGEDWKKIYTYALEHDFRFLSYGDGSLLYINR